MNENKKRRLTSHKNFGTFTKPGRAAPRSSNKALTFESSLYFIRSTCLLTYLNYKDKWCIR